jgi:16S rRNA (uracil1498-N3)-methyltransferase
LDKIDKHLFAVYVANYSGNYKNFEIKDSALCHRIMRVLRLSEGDNVIVFDKVYNSIARVEGINRKSISLSATKLEKNEVIQPKVTLAVGILKRDNFEQLVYNSVALGVNVIQPLITEKSQRSKLSDRDKERLEKIMISAAEQSKNYSLSCLQEPIELGLFLKQSSAPLKIFFDVDGMNVASLSTSEVKNGDLLVGPEGDFTIPEKKLILDSGFKAYKLAPTILRAVDAAIVGAGIIRSIFNKN